MSPSRITAAGRCSCTAAMMCSNRPWQSPPKKIWPVCCFAFMGQYWKVAEGARFELAGDRRSPTRLKRAAIDHSATPPCSLV